MSGRIQILALALLSVMLLTDRSWAFSQGWVDAVSKACNRSESDCYRECKRAQKAKVIADLPNVYERTCNDVLTAGDTKSLKENGKACSTTSNSCLVRLNLASKSGSTYFYRGNGYAVSVDYTSPHHMDTIIVASIDAPGHGRTIITKDCAPDGSCEGWERKSGLLAGAQLSILDHGAVLQFRQ